MPQNVGRNAPCPCGSGQKYKHCCEGTTSWYETSYVKGIGLVAILAAALVLASLAFDGDESAVERPPGPAPEGKVWSPEHGHWHDAY